MVNVKCKCGKSRKNFIKLHEGQINDGDWECEFCEEAKKAEEIQEVIEDFEVEEFFEDTSEEEIKVENLVKISFEDLKKEIFENKENICCIECQKFECEKCECGEKVEEPEMPKEEIKIEEKLKKKKRGRKSKK
jgi:hypothetical protein